MQFDFRFICFFTDVKWQIYIRPGALTGKNGTERRNR
ncbi:hypothetical protein FB461_1169 [Rarobacter faecitabidus]|uniref:Uncharacterized protein n=1 Tax=Rarobacter faecitabidus TaxID=13243 RepID=A0A542ZWU0_RARFA|nr:hypothetical protein FB461_1169 [Rarobacter faecitabidus]